MGCSPTAQSKKHAVTPEVWQITLDPALQWLRPTASQCMVDYPGIALSIEESGQIKAGIIHIGWGEQKNDSTSIFRLANDSPAIIVNPQNPISQITYQTAREVLNGNIRDWNTVDSSAASLGNIQLWNYPSNEGMYAIYSDWFKNKNRAAAIYQIAPDPSSMLEAVAKNSSAVGWLPARGLSDGVKSLKITDHSNELPSIPVLVYLNKNPGNSFQAWIFCMQQKLQ